MNWQRRRKATITVTLHVNGNPITLHPDTFTVIDGDTLDLSLDSEIPIVQRPGTEVGMRILRVVEIVEPKVEP